MPRYTIDNRPEPINFHPRNLTERTLQNAKNLLMTRMGEVPYDRYRGFDHALYDLPLTRLEEALPAELNRVMLWDPDVTVVGCACRMEGTAEVVIAVEIDINIGE